MLSHFLQWAGGQVRVRVRGASVERFLNVCMRGGISLWRIERPAPGEITARMSLSDFRRLRHLMGRTGCRVHLLSRRGGPFFLARVRKRWSLTAGLAGVAALLFVLSNFLWVLEICAAPGVPVGRLRALLRENGVYAGAPLRGVDVDRVREALQTGLPEAGVVTFTRIGNALRVVADRAEPAPPMRDEDALTGLVAARDGVIVSLEVTGGQTLVKTGDVVTQGQTLVSPVVPPTREGGLYHHSPGRGRIMARTEHRETVLCPTERLEKRYTGAQKTQYALVLGTRRVNLYFGSGIAGGTCDKIVEKTRLSIGPYLSLPVSVVRQTYRFYEPVPVTERAETAAEAAAGRYFDRLAQTVDGTVGETGWELQEEEGAVRLTLHAACVEQIACEVIDETPLPEPEPEPAESPS